MTRTEHQRVLTEMVCAKCGAAIPVQPGSTRRLYDEQPLDAPFELSGHEILRGWWHADLCGSCGREVVAFIDAGRGPGVREAWDEGGW